MDLSLIVKQEIILFMLIMLTFRSWNQPVLGNNGKCFLLKETTRVFDGGSTSYLTLIHRLGVRLTTVPLHPACVDMGSLGLILIYANNSLYLWFLFMWMNGWYLTRHNVALVWLPRSEVSVFKLSRIIRRTINTWPL